MWNTAFIQGLVAQLFAIISFVADNIFCLRHSDKFTSLRDIVDVAARDREKRWISVGVSQHMYLSCIATF